jgi:hypothetical protein
MRSLRTKSGAVVVARACFSDDWSAYSNLILPEPLVQTKAETYLIDFAIKSTGQQ